MAVFLAPGFGAGYQSFLDNGAVNSNGFIQTYAAGSSTPLATYTTSSGSVANGVPPLGLQLGVNGRPPFEIWLTQGSAYKFIVTDQYGNLLTNGTFDNIVGVGDVSAQEPWTVAQGGTGTTTGFGFTYPCGISGGTANALLLTSTPTVTSYGLGQEFIFSALNTNTGATTVNIDGIGVTYIQLNGQALTGGEILAQGGYRLVGDGTGFQLETISASGVISSYVGLELLGGTAGGSANAIVLAFTSPNYLVQKKGQSILFLAATTNTGAVTVNINSIGATAIQNNQAACVSGDIVAGYWYKIFYDGSVWQLFHPQLGPGLGTVFGPSGANIYQNSWTDAGTVGGIVYQVPKYYRDILTFVNLTGVAATGTATPGTTMAKLPSGQGLYPYAAIGFGCMSGSAFGGFTVDTSGNIVIRAGVNTTFGFDGARWIGNPTS